MSTIYEVAKLAGVSPATVSRVYNGLGVSPEKAKAVRDAAKKLKYTPNRTARSLRRQASEVIALIIPDIENPHFTELARGVEDVASSAGFSVVLCNTDAQMEKEATYLKIAISENMAGVILAPAYDHTNLDEFLASGRPLIAMDRTAGYDVDAVIMSNRSAGEKAAENLVQAGFRRIACITGWEQVETARERADGWRSVMQRSFPDWESDELLRYSTFRVEGGREVMAELLSLPEPPDAVVAASNLIGVGVVLALIDHGMTMPDFGVAVVGGLPFNVLPQGALTHIRMPSRQMGLTAARMLLDRIGGDNQPPRTIVLRNFLAAGGIPPRALAN